MPQVMLVTSEGYLYEYSIDLEKGGECMLLKQHRSVHKVIFNPKTHMNNN